MAIKKHPIQIKMSFIAMHFFLFIYLFVHIYLFILPIRNSLAEIKKKKQAVCRAVADIYDTIRRFN